MTIEATLERLGLTRQEAVIYVATLKLGTAKVSAIAHKAKAKREAAYYTISLLETKGLIVPILRKGVTYYSAVDPKKIFEYIEQEKAHKERAASKVIGELEKLYQTAVTPPAITIYEGSAVVNLPEFEEKNICGYSPANLMEVLVPTEPHYAVKLITDKKGAALIKNNAKYTVGVLDVVHDADTAMLIFSDSVLTIKASGSDAVAMHIKDKAMAALHRNIFTAMWKEAD